MSRSRDNLILGGGVSGGSSVGIGLLEVAVWLGYEDSGSIERTKKADAVIHLNHRRRNEVYEKRLSDLGPEALRRAFRLQPEELMFWARKGAICRGPYSE